MGGKLKKGYSGMRRVEGGMLGISGEQFGFGSQASQLESRAEKTVSPKPSEFLLKVQQIVRAR